MKTENCKSSIGFTMIELLLYMGILVILISVFSVIFASIIDTQLSSKSTSTVDQDSRYILARLIHDMQLAQDIATPSATMLGQNISTLKLVINSTPPIQYYTYNTDNNGNLQLNNNIASTTDNLNSAETTVSNLSFQRIGNGSTTDTIQVNFTLTSKVNKKSGPETKTYQSTLSMP